MFSKRLAQELQWAEHAKAGLSYAFVVTHEYELDAPGDVPPLLPTTDGTYGPPYASDEAVANARTKGQPWRMLDDDGIVCAKGLRWASDSPEDWTKSDACWAPLNDYGGPEFGATRLQFRAKGQWVTLCPAPPTHSPAARAEQVEKGGRHGRVQARHQPGRAG